MLTCDDARDELALDPTTNDPAVREHMQACARCAAYTRRNNALDTLARAELHWDVPTDLAARLMAIAMSPTGFAVPPRHQPKRWHVALAYTATIASILLALLIVWQVATLVITQYGLQAQVSALLALPSQWQSQLTHALPESRYVIDLLSRARTQLVWLLVVALVWAMLDKWNPQMPSFRRRQGA